MQYLGFTLTAVMWNYIMKRYDPQSYQKYLTIKDELSIVITSRERFLIYSFMCITDKFCIPASYKEMAAIFKFLQQSVMNSNLVLMSLSDT
ncbi:hypothetical protein PR048_012826, partial [Dryococelus australis]